MKTLADFKRRAMVGSKWETTYHHGEYVECMGIREIVKSSGTKIVFRDYQGKESSFYFPKADALQYEGEDTVRYYTPDNKLKLTYTIIT